MKRARAFPPVSTPYRHALAACGLSRERVHNASAYGHKSSPYLRRVAYRNYENNIF
jgi:hypothetical protein